MKPLPKIEPMELVQQAAAFDNDDWLFEIKHDGFRSLAYIEDGICKLVSRNEYDYKRFRDLAEAMPSAINAKNAILDGELVVLDRTGKARFYDLMAGRGVVVRGREAAVRSCLRALVERTRKLAHACDKGDEARCVSR